MNYKAALGLFIFLIFSSCSLQAQKNYIFFLHNRFLEGHSLTEEHPEYGKAEYLEIIKKFRDKGFVVISEKRSYDTNAKDYAFKVKGQIDSLLLRGVAPGRITVIGTSKGGYIAQYVSTLARNPALNFVFIGSFQESDIANIPEINFCGNILTIYEKSDHYGVSAISRKETSKLKINHFREVELNTGLRHGFLFQALDAWIEPSIQWASQHYSVK